MENESLISIVVPVYNTKKYIDKCLECLVHQTYKNIEIILVDDGSTDGSSEICDLYMEKDDRIKVIHKANNGVSSARNDGINVASGNYIMFVDSDDCVNLAICEELYEAAQTCDADLVMSDYVPFINYNEIGQYSIYDGGRTRIEKEKIVEFITNNQNKAGITVYTKLFKSHMAKKLQFTEGAALGEDQEYVFRYIKECRNIIYVNKIMYYYLIRENSAMHCSFNIKNEKEFRNTFTRIIDYSDYLSAKDKRILLDFRLCQCELTILNKMIIGKSFDKELFCEMRKYVFNNMAALILGKYSMKKKIQVCVAFCCLPLYLKVYMKKIRGMAG